MNRQFGWCLNSYLHRVTFDAKYFYDDATIDNDAFVKFAR